MCRFNGHSICHYLRISTSFVGQGELHLTASSNIIIQAPPGPCQKTPVKRGKGGPDINNKTA